jgi:preprotein translocase subunit SecD
MTTKLPSSQIRAKMRWGLLGIVVLFFASLLYVFPSNYNEGARKINASFGFGLPIASEKSFNLGLDLQGGAHLVYEAAVDTIPAADRSGAVEGVRDVIERRVNGLGVSEPTVQTTNVGEKYNIIVELPGVKDVKRAIDLIGETPILEFREQNLEPPRTLTAEEQKQLTDFNADAKKRADNIFKEVKASGDLLAAVNKYSEDSESKNNSGYFGYVGFEHRPSGYPESLARKSGA